MRSLAGLPSQLGECRERLKILILPLRSARPTHRRLQHVSVVAIKLVSQTILCEAW